MRESDLLPVEAVVFDVGRVLFEWDLRHLFRKLLSDAAEVERIVTEVVTEEWHFQHDAGRPLAEMVPERQAQFPADAHLIEAYAARFGESIPGPVPGSLDLVEALALREVPLFAITNFGAEFWPPFREREAVFDHFREIVVSGIEQVAKPEAEIFHRAAARFGHAPEAMLFIDDNAANVAAAQALGWQVHRFTDADTLRADLAARGLIAPLP
jgi:2-haloacid dehalogenase